MKRERLQLSTIMRGLNLLEYSIAVCVGFSDRLFVDSRLLVLGHRRVGA